MKTAVLKYLSILIFISANLGYVWAQCPTISNPIQSFCDIQTPTVNNLSATDNGGGLQWFLVPSGGIPLNTDTPLLNGTTYYAGDNTNNCINRPSVTVVIYGAPTAPNFQGICVGDLSEATVSNLVAVGNNIQWFLSPLGGFPLDPNTPLVNNTLYFAEQTNPDTGCKTSRRAVFVTITVINIPLGAQDQFFCYNPNGAPPTLNNIVTGKQIGRAHV